MVKPQHLPAAWPRLSCCSMTMNRALSILLFVLISSVTARGDQEVLPRILLIGDSISIGYTPFVSEIYQGRAEVFRNKGNAQHTGTGLEKLDEWLGDGNWDLIHFNWGLHDLCYRHLNSPNQGRRDKERGFLQPPLSSMKRIWIPCPQISANWGPARLANTSYVPDGELGRRRDVYNAVAEKVISATACPPMISDQHASFPANRLEQGDVHYTKGVPRLLGCIGGCY